MAQFLSKTATEFKQGRIGWAQWRSKKGAIMWPCLIEKYGKDSSNSMKVFIKYYELNNKVGNTFKLHPSKVELFYRSNEHFEHKVQFFLNFFFAESKIFFYFFP